MQTPSKIDWGNIDDNDIELLSSFKTFFGTSISEAEAIFQRNALFYQEELQSMPRIPFNFYAPALVNYITSDRARDDSDGASSFLNMVSWMLKSNRNVVEQETALMLLAAAEQVAGRQPFYGADPSIYGSFAELNARIQELAERDI